MTIQDQKFAPFSKLDAMDLLSVPQTQLLSQAAEIRDLGHGRVVSYSRKVFIPLTQLCRDVCHYCTFAKAPKRIDAPYLTPDQVLEIAKAGQAAGCKEALFTLGTNPRQDMQLRVRLSPRWGTLRPWIIFTPWPNWY